MSDNFLDDILSGGAKNPFGRDAEGNDAPVGTSVTGTITNIAKRQVTDINTKEPQNWPDGNPKEQAVITLKTEQKVDEEDNGERSVYIKLWGLQKQALKEASQAAKGVPEVGDTFTATFVGLGKRTNPAFNPPKIYKYEIKKGSPLESSLGVQTVNAQPAQTVASALDAALAKKVSQLIGLGLADDKIVQAIDGVTVEQVAQVRLQAAASSGAGF